MTSTSTLASAPPSENDATTPKTMRVTLLAYRDDRKAGGSLRVAETLSKGLRVLGIDARVCFAYGGPGPLSERPGIRCDYLGLENSQDLRHWPRVRAYLHQFKPHIVHAIDPIVWFHVAALGIRYRAVVHVHGAGWWRKIPFRTRLVWTFLRWRTTRYVCITSGATRRVAERGFARPGQAATVYNGVDIDWFDARPDRLSARRLLHIPPEALVIGMACRLEGGRSCDDLLRIVNQLEPCWHALLAGDGEDRPMLERLAQQLGISDRVHITGFLNDVRPAYSAMDAFAFLARYDSFGLATAEAMACRVPVFGLGALGEYREPENPLVTPENAIFLERANPEDQHSLEDPAILTALAKKIDAFGRKPDSLTAVIVQARRHVEERFSLRAQAEGTLSVYRSLFPTKRPA